MSCNEQNHNIGLWMDEENKDVWTNKNDKSNSVAFEMEGFQEFSIILCLNVFVT